jgi:hypothetical protein
MEVRRKKKFEDIGEIKPEEPQVPEVDLKPLPKGLKYEFWAQVRLIQSLWAASWVPKKIEVADLLKNIGRWLDIQSMISKDLAQPFALIVYQWKTNVSLW